MTLYHFTARHMADAIQREGITRGFVLLSFEARTMDGGYRWLTTNGSWDQSWADGTGRLPYKRNEVRFTIEVPESQHERVLQWKVVGPIITGEYGLLSAYGDPENWRLVRGNVPPGWIKLREDNPAYARAALVAAGIRVGGGE